MQVFGFDMLPYPKRLDHLTVDDRLPYPLPKQHFEPKAAAATYQKHLDAWAFMESVGFSGVGFNEHHVSPFGMVNSPNLMAAAASQHTSQMQLLIYGNLLPLHEPLRMAEELAMLDCMTGGRIISGFARGIPREYKAYNVDVAESRARFEEAWEIIKRAWTEETFSYEGQFWSYHDVSIWPRPIQQPHPPVWMPVTMSKESIEWAARQNIPITPGEPAPQGPPTGMVQDIVRYYAQCLEQHGYHITPRHLVLAASVYVSDSREQAFQEAGPYLLYFLRSLLGHGSIRSVEQATRQGWASSEAYDYINPDHLQAFLQGREGVRQATLDEISREDRMCWGTPDDVRDALITWSDTIGADILLLNFNQGALPYELYMQNLTRFGEEVLPALKAHHVTTVPLS